MINKNVYVFTEELVLMCGIGLADGHDERTRRGTYCFVMGVFWDAEIGCIANT